MSGMPASSHDPIWHAVRRLTYGPTPALVAQVKQLGLAAWLDEQLTDATDSHGTLASPESFPLPVVAQNNTPQARNYVQDLQIATFSRAVWGDRQLYELLVEFWSNHFSIQAEKVGNDKVVDDREVIRPHALGTFNDMLLASAQSPAMLRYLNNASSHGNAPNENYARELLELHTVGVHGGYRQRDVRDAARVLTGLGVDEHTGLFIYRPEWHATGHVQVLGWSHANADASTGVEVATSLLSYLAHHPATAQRLAKKLVRRLVDDSPPANLVASAAQVYLSGRTSLTPVVRHIVLSPYFARSVGAKSQRPYDWCAAAVRALGLKQQPSMVSDGGGVPRLLEQLGQLPFAWGPPDGYPDTTLAWSSTASMLARWNAAQALVFGHYSGFKPLDVAALVGTPAPATAGALVDRLAANMFGLAPRPALSNAVLAGGLAKASATVDQGAVNRLAPVFAALLLCSPEAQVR